MIRESIDMVLELQYREAMEKVPLGFTVDERGNVIAFKAADGYCRIYRYDDQNRLIDAGHEDGYWCSYNRDDQDKTGVYSWENSLGMTATLGRKEEFDILVS